MTCLNSERVDLTEDERRGFHFGRGVLSIHNLAIDEQNTVDELNDFSFEDA